MSSQKKFQDRELRMGQHNLKSDVDTLRQEQGVLEGLVARWDEQTRVLLATITKLELVGVRFDQRDRLESVIETAREQLVRTNYRIDQAYDELVNAFTGVDDERVMMVQGLVREKIKAVRQRHRELAAQFQSWDREVKVGCVTMNRIMGSPHDWVDWFTKFVGAR